MDIPLFNRELSWIEFNKRVLNQALDKDLPLLERLQFLSIVSSNFNEFFQVRVASIKRLKLTNPEYQDEAGYNLDTLLKKISLSIHSIVKTQHECLTQDIFPALSQKKISYIKPVSFSSGQSEFVTDFFNQNLFPLLTPLRTDSKVFPNFSNLSIYVAFLLKPIEGIHDANLDFMGEGENPRIACVEVPTNINALLWLPSETKERQFTLTAEVIAQYGTRLFPGFNVEETLIFKVIRDADFAVDEDSSANFIHAMEKVLIKRKSSFPVCIMANSTSKTILDYITCHLELQEEDIYTTKDIVDISSLMGIREVDEEGKLSYPEWKHYYPTELPEDSPYWDILKTRDILLHVPYESYDPVIKFLNDAAGDKDVLAIKMTLYRTGNGSPVVAALEKAARRGKNVVVLVELKARFDEERNIAWATELENAGATVIYGLVNLKVHAKILMVMRKENESVRRYIHLSTGNYNPKTAKLYSDLSLFTSNYEIANDATHFFNLVTGYSTLQSMNLLSMAPVTLKNRLVSMINREAERQEAEHNGLIIAKMNSLTHPDVIAALYHASQKKVKILLNIRGICMLVPGVKGVSENIKVVSIVDRYLEHSRIFYFQNGDTPEIYLSSADWMGRNLDRRIELMFPLLDKDVFKEVRQILFTYFTDNHNSSILLTNGEWKKIDATDAPLLAAGEASVTLSHAKQIRAQEALYKKYRKRNTNANTQPKIEFEVRRKD